MALTLQTLVIAAGALSYVGYFSRGEHHLYATTYIRLHTLAFLGLVALLYRLGFQLAEAVSQTCMYDGLFLTGLFAFLLVYRAFLNPLNAFPGPWTARITSFDMPIRNRKSQLYKTLQKLHHQYGHFVRIGTGELSITHPNAVVDIFGAESVCPKSAWYDISRPQDSLLLRRTQEGHSELRRIWSTAFSIKAIRGYEERIQPYRSTLLANLDTQVGQTFNLNPWLGWYSWDVMSDLSFGRPFGMLDNKDRHWAIDILKKGMSVVGIHLPMWYIRLFVDLPGGRGDMKLMLKYCEEEMLSRWENEPKVPDVMSHLMAPYRSYKTWNDAAVNLMAGEAHLLVNAGSDTTRTTITCALYELAKQPELQNKLQEAIAPHVSQSPDDPILDHQISTIELLDGVVWEALRMWPPSPSHPTRVTPPQGTIIAGRFIPGGTQLMAPQYVIGRDETLFPRPTEFIPERWHSAPGLCKDKNALAPFSLGPWNCIGKQFAMMNVRVTLATIVMRYKLSFAPDRPDPIGEFERGMCEHFSLHPGQLYVRLERRK